MNIEAAKEQFGKLLESQLKRAEQLKEQLDFIDFKEMPELKIGICHGDGIGPFITAQAKRVLEHLLAEDIKKGKIALVDIEGLTIENRIKKNSPIPDEVMDLLFSCPVILKGPTTTPKASDNMPNIESANVAMRKALDLFANIRPVRVPELGIDWTFFRENSEGAYALGSCGIRVSESLSVDFTVVTQEGTRRIIKAAFDYAIKNGKTKVTAVTKANIIKLTDGIFLRTFYEIAKQYPQIETDDWFIDIMTAKLIDEKRRRDFQVLVMPNLYGDILTDEAAEFQGGVGTAGSANIGKRYAMFEAIHGSAPRMVDEGRGIYADPCSMLRATVMLLSHIGKQKEADRLTSALDFCAEQKKVVITGRDNGATSEQLADYIMQLIDTQYI